MPLAKVRLGGPQFTGSWLLPLMPASPDTFVRFAKYGVVSVGQARELIAQPQRQELREPVGPVDLRIDGRRLVLDPRSRTASSSRSSSADTTTLPKI